MNGKAGLNKPDVVKVDNKYHPSGVDVLFNKDLIKDLALSTMKTNDSHKNLATADGGLYIGLGVLFIGFACMFGTWLGLKIYKQVQLQHECYILEPSRLPPLIELEDEDPKTPLNDSSKYLFDSSHWSYVDLKTTDKKDSKPADIENELILKEDNSKDKFIKTNVQKVKEKFSKPPTNDKIKYFQDDMKTLEEDRNQYKKQVPDDKFYIFSESEKSSLDKELQEEKTNNIFSTKYNGSTNNGVYSTKKNELVADGHYSREKFLRKLDPDSQISLESLPLDYNYIEEIIHNISSKKCNANIDKYKILSAGDNIKSNEMLGFHYTTDKYFGRSNTNSQISLKLDDEYQKKLSAVSSKKYNANNDIHKIRSLSADDILKNKELADFPYNKNKSRKRTDSDSQISQLAYESTIISNEILKDETFLKNIGESDYQQFSNSPLNMDYFSGNKHSANKKSFLPRKITTLFHNFTGLR